MLVLGWNGWKAKSDIGRTLAQCRPAYIYQHDWAGVWNHALSQRNSPDRHCLLDLINITQKLRINLRS